MSEAQVAQYVEGAPSSNVLGILIFESIISGGRCETSYASALPFAWQAKYFKHVSSKSLKHGGTEIASELWDEKCSQRQHERRGSRCAQ